MIKVNGELYNFDDKTVREYLNSTSYDQARIAVEINGEIIPKSKYNTVVLNDGDCVEIVSFVGGG